MDSKCFSLQLISVESWKCIQIIFFYDSNATHFKNENVYISNDNSSVLEFERGILMIAFNFMVVLIIKGRVLYIKIQKTLLAKKTFISKWKTTVNI